MSERDSSQQRPTDTNSDLLLGHLRSIVLEPYEARLEEVERRMAGVRREVEDLRKGELEPAEIGEMLPAAITSRGDDDEKLAYAMSPLIEDGLQQSVKKNPQPLVDVIFPILGPAIRKSIATAMRGLVESVNRTVESTFTPRGIRWRVEAWRTGKSYGEVVLKHTLLYRVEGAYLIQRQSGLLLQHVIAPEVEVQKPELVSSMLTAIEDFARDSFSTNGDGGLEQFRVGDLTVLVESGPHAVLALAVRGAAAPEVRTHAQVALEEVHKEFRHELADFDGQNAAFEAARPTLEDCLRDEMKEPKRFPVAALATGVLLLAVCALLAITWVSGRVESKHWKAYVQRLQEEPGLMVVHTEEEGGTFRLVGMRDPLAPDPWAMLADHKVPRGDVEARWEYFRAQHPDFVLARARQVLRPPSGVVFDLQERALRARGSASRMWIEQAERLALLIPGVAQWDGRSLRDERLRVFDAPVAAVEEIRLNLAAIAPAGDPSLREGARALALRMAALDARAARAGARVAISLVVPAAGSREAETEWRKAVRLRELLMEETWQATLIEVVRAGEPQDRRLRVQARVRFASSM